ncbi:unnamed protein product, partial [Choristocarpus tenellus]
SILRPYQSAVIERAVALYESGKRRLLVPLATGLGKTVVFTHLPQVRDVREFFSPGRCCCFSVWAFPSLCKKGTLVLVHRDELVIQAVSTVRRFLPHLTVGVEK